MPTRSLTAPLADTTHDPIPWIIVVDDHVTEPPDLWTSRLPRKFKDRGPQVRRDKILVPTDARQGGTQFGHPDVRVDDAFEHDKIALVALLNGRYHVFQVGWQVFGPESMRRIDMGVGIDDAKFAPGNRGGKRIAEFDD
jgi:hypothetical protein